MLQTLECRFVSGVHQIALAVNGPKFGSSMVLNILTLNKVLRNFYRCTVHSDIHTVHSPTDARLLKLLLQFTLKLDVAPTRFVLRPSLGSLQFSLAKFILILKHSVRLRRNLLCGGVAACPSMACVLCAVQSGTQYTCHTGTRCHTTA